MSWSHIQLVGLFRKQRSHSGRLSLRLAGVRELQVSGPTKQHPQNPTIKRGMLRHHGRRLRGVWLRDERRDQVVPGKVRCIHIGKRAQFLHLKAWNFEKVHPLISIPKYFSCENPQVSSTARFAIVDVCEKPSCVASRASSSRRQWCVFLAANIRALI